MNDNKISSCSISHHFLIASCAPPVPPLRVLLIARHKSPRHAIRSSPENEIKLLSTIECHLSICVHLLGTFSCCIFDISTVTIIQQVHIDQVSESAENLLQHMNRQCVRRADDEAALRAIGFLRERLDGWQVNRAEGRTGAVVKHDLWWSLKQRKVLQLWAQLHN